MTLVVPNVGEIELLNKMLKAALTVNEDYTMKLYKNNATPDQNSVATDFTEATFTGYAAKTLLRSNWVSSTTVSNKAQSQYPQQSWTCGATGDTIYGYYMVGATSTILLWAERFTNPRVLTNGDILNITPVFTLNSEV
jgi:hypothetical protein